MSLARWAVAVIVSWVLVATPPTSTADGEPKPPHWSFQPVRRPAVPEIPRDAWSRNPVDRFVLRRLRQQQLEPSAKADRPTLIRRASFDLLGLPPSPAEIDRFVDDTAPDAWERLLDRLLASPHHGERWGRYWLDIARYADNKGYVFFEQKEFPWAWTYRDYVIESFNEDRRYDRFILEQLAADLIDLDDQPRRRAAMGFLTLGGRFMNNLHDMLDDQIDVVTRGLMGLTLTCARCHDHKYDPVPQADYYSLYGVFRSSAEPLIPPRLEPPLASETDGKFASELELRFGTLRDFISTKHTELVAAARSRAAEYLLRAQQTLDQPPTDDFMLLTTAGGLNPTVVLRWRVYLEERTEDHDPVWAAWQVLAALPETNFSDLAREALRKLADDCGPDRPLNPLVLQSLMNPVPDSLAAAAETYGRLLKATDALWQAKRALAIVGKVPAPSRLDDPAAEQLRLVLDGPGAPPNIPRSFGWGFLALLPDRPAQDEYKKLRKAVETWVSTGPGAPPRAMVLEEHLPAFSPRVFQRGNPHRRGQAVPRRLPAVLGGTDRQPFRHGSGRLELARAITASDNPLTARVLVNRVWMHHFGAGLVTTPADFGTRGNPPSHPELLDFLADWFVHDADWSIKKLHRLMMNSATYCQSSAARPAAERVDPLNRRLWRMNRRRLDFESMRDSQLWLAGALDRRLGGPPVDIYKGDKLVPRRSLYGFIDRMNPAPLLRTFDFPNPLSSCAVRGETTVPPQALFLMNNAVVHECAGRLAARPEVTRADDATGRVRMLYRLVLGRVPTREESDATTRFLEQAGAADKQTWTTLAHALLMTNEAVFVD